MSMEERARRSEIGKRFYAALPSEEKERRSFGKVSKIAAQRRLAERIDIDPILADPKMWRRYNGWVNGRKVKNPDRVLKVLTASTCDVCDRPLTSGRGKNSRHVDHCHKTNFIRGALCNNCNIALGYVDDDPTVLEKLALYLRANNCFEQAGLVIISGASELERTGQYKNYIEKLRKLFGELV